MQKIIRLTLRIMPALFWIALAVVAALMLMTLSPPKVKFYYIDKVEHAFVFMVLAGMGFTAWSQRKRIVILGLALFGAVMEVAQEIFTSYRQATVGDWLADLVGIMLAYIIYRYYVNHGLHLGKC